MGRVDLHGLQAISGAACSGAGTACVRILCRRSAILMRMTRMSLAMAMSILRRFSICSSSLLVYCTRVSLVTPSTMSATAVPNWRAMSAWVRLVSSMTSWSRAAMIESSSSPMSTDDIRRRDAVGYVRRAVLAQLTGVRDARHLVGRPYAPEIHRMSAVFDLLLKLGVHLVRIQGECSSRFI